MKRLILIVTLVLLSSCDTFDKKKIDTKEYLDEELRAIDWSDVDEYPTFTICDSSNAKKNCFENVIRTYLNAQLSRQTIVVTEDISDTISLKIHIDNQGRFTLKSIESSDLIKLQIPQLDSILRHSFDSLPKIYPAIKRSQQVATEFSLPVVVNIN